MGKTVEVIDIVNGRDEIIGQDTLQNVYKNGAWHRAAHVWVFNSAGELYLQERGRAALLFPLCSLGGGTGRGLGDVAEAFRPPSNGVEA